MPNGSYATFVRALLFGAGAAVLGLVLYTTFGILMGVVAGYLSLGVGYLVGKAMMIGSRGVGGRRYQVAAVLFTHAAVSLSAIPISVGYQIKHTPAALRQMPWQTPDERGQRSARALEADRQLREEFGNGAARQLPARTGAQKTDAVVGTQDGSGASVGSSQQNSAAQGNRPSGLRPRSNLASAVGYLVLVGLASHLLALQEPVQGLIGLVILLVGIFIAWRLTEARSVEIVGPFESAAGAVA
ncbi:MAG TPA: hypothetical protein VK466_18455 [Terriglobales bacterium]|nr:hypothetical protein [Terriglobales bacterium]